MTTTLREGRAWLSIAVSLCALGATACSDGNAEPNAGGHTNWLRCMRLADCDHAQAAACSGGYCVDEEGNRLQHAAAAGDAGTSSGDSGSGANVAGSGGGNDGGSPPDGSGSGGGSSAGTGGGAGSGRGDASTPPEGGAGASGSGSGGAGGSAGSGGAGCDFEGAACCDPFPGDGQNYCNSGLTCCANGCSTTCDNGQGAVRIPECPGTVNERCASEACTSGTCLECTAGQVCLQVELSCGPAGGSTAQCIDDPCDGNALDCACAARVCDVLEPAPGGWTCGAFTQDHFLVGPDRDPYMTCGGGGICASPDTAIATPNGEVPIAELRVGDLVYSRTADAIVVVPLLAVARTPVFDHHVLRVTLEGGSTLEVSGPHPTAAGPRLDELAVGERLEQQRVVAVERIPYAHAFTYDVLPASESGSYLANGVWLGSTLAGGH